MSLLEEVKRMQQQGTSEDHIIQTLREKGVSYRDIAEALAQGKIKSAVEQPATDPEAPYPSGKSESDSMYGQVIEGMEPSMMSTATQPRIQEVDASPQPPIPSYANPSQQPQEYNPQYPEYSAQPPSYNQTATSPDLITEIAEQVVAEKLGDLRKHLEKVIDLKTTMESRIEYVDERLKKIEKTIDILQSSVLRKVGDYVTNVQDIKRELIETQKTFTKMSSHAKHASPQNKQHHVNQHHEHSQHHSQQSNSKHHVNHKSHDKK